MIGAEKGRRALLMLMAAIAAEPTLRAQPARKSPRIGLLLPDVEMMPERRAAMEALHEGLRELGWIDGKTLTIETRLAGFDPQRQREVAAQLKALPVALIIAVGTITIRAARDGAPGVPIVMVNAGDPVGAGLAVSLARPGGDLTGTSAAGEEVLAKQLELLSAAVPHFKRVGLLMNTANPANHFFFDAVAGRAKPLGLQLDRIEVGADSSLEAAIGRARGGALIVVGDPMFHRQRVRIIEAALRARVPAMFGGRDYVADGGLMSYLSDYRWHWHSAAGYVDKILKGVKPGEIPIAQPTRFELIINLKTARALGVTIPQSLILRADEVIQ